MMKGKKLIKCLGNGISTLLIILLICGVFVVIFSRISEGEPSLFGYQLKTVLSGSMEPELQEGSLILTQLIDEKETFKNGDIITFKTEDNVLITHRIMGVENAGKQFITKGDNNNGLDIEPVLVENIVGKYSGWTIPNLGYAFYYLNSKQGTVLFLIIPGLLFLGHAMFTIWRTIQLIEIPKEANFKKK